MKSILGVFSVFLGLTACATNNRPATIESANAYAQECAAAARKGDLRLAEDRCYMAWFYTEFGTLGTSEYKSDRMFDLGRVKRRVRKYAEAERIFRDSLKLEESVASPAEHRVGLRLAELALVLAEQNKRTDGLQFAERLRPLISRFAGEERLFVTGVLVHYGLTPSQ